MHTYKTLQHYMQVLHQHIRFILLGVILATGITGGVNLLLPPVYQANSLIKVNGTTGATATQGTNDVFSAQAQAVSYALLVTSPEVLQEASKELPGMSANDIGRTVSDSPLENTQLIEVRAQANSAPQAAKIANTVVNAFVQVQQTRENIRIQTLTNQLKQELLQAKVALDTAVQQQLAVQNQHANEQVLAQQKTIIDTEQANYNTLLANYNQVQAQKLQANDTLRIAQIAVPPQSPISPQILLNTVLAAGLGLLIMILMSLLLDWADATIKTTEDVINLTQLEPLGGIPAGISRTDTLLKEITAPTNELQECMMMIGKSLHDQHKTARTIMVSGLHSRTGVSTLATYMALGLAQTGKRILLVDANLQHPMLHNIFQHPANEGLVNHLPDVHHFTSQPDILPPAWLNQWCTQFPNLWLLPAGPSVTNPATLLRAPELRLIKEWLLGEHPLQKKLGLIGVIDLIIFDTCSLSEGVSTQALTDIVDGTVLLIEAGKEQSETIQQTQEMLQRLGAPILGVVINRQKARQQSYFYAQHLSVQQRVLMPNTPVVSMLKETTKAEEPDQSIQENSLQRKTSDRIPAITYVPLPELKSIYETPSPIPTPSKATDKLFAYQMTHQAIESQQKPTRMQFKLPLNTRNTGYIELEDEQKL